MLQTLHTFPNVFLNLNITQD